MSNKTAIMAVVYGKVQGVFFRASTRDKARELGISGWVKNEPDGTVRVHAAGELNRIEALISWLHEGPSSAHVDKVEWERITPEGHTSFDIRR